MTANRDRNAEVLFALALGALAIALCVLFSGCATFSDSARVSLMTAAKVESTAVGAFVSYDHSHQMDIVREAQTREAGEAALRAYREKQGAVLQAFLGASSALEIATVALDAYDAGKAASRDVAKLVAVALDAALRLKDALKAAGVPLPGGL